MITSKQEYLDYICTDAKCLRAQHSYLDLFNPILRFQRLLRYTEYIMNCKRGRLWSLYKLFLKWRLMMAGLKLGFTIPANVFGKGLCIVHWGTITIAPEVKVGDYCRILEDVNIGHFKDGAPNIGDYVFIGPGAKIIGNINIGNKVVIGAGSVVTKNVPNSVTVAGVPAKIISNKSSFDYDTIRIWWE